MHGHHGQIVQQHVVLESKQGQEHVRMILQTLASHSLNKKVAPLPQPVGLGQVVRTHVVMVSRQEQEHALTIKEVQPMSRKLSNKLATFKNAVMTLGQHGVHGIHAPIVVLVHLKKNVRDVNSFKYPRVHKKVNQFNTSIKRRIVHIMATGVPVSSNKNKFIYCITHLGYYCGRELANMVLNAANGCRRVEEVDAATVSKWLWKA